MQEAIVTGANGFIGSAVCRALLNKNIKVYAIIHNASDNLPISDNLTIIKGDLKNLIDLRDALYGVNADVFYHFAWEGASGAVLANESVQIPNIAYTCDILRLASDIKCKRFIFSGTINELELVNLYNADKYLPRAACIYGVAKLSADFMAKTLSRELNIEYITGVIGSSFGPGDKSWRIHNTVIDCMLKNTSPSLVSGEALHDWVYIDDIADLFYAIGVLGHNMKSYYLGHRNLRKLKDIVLDVRDTLAPCLEIKFGEIKDNFHIDYSLMDLNAVYKDTGQECKCDFKGSIVKTAEWVKFLRKEGI